MRNVGNRKNNNILWRWQRNLERIFSNEIRYSVLCIFTLASLLLINGVFIVHSFGKPWGADDANTWGVLIIVVNYYAWWWVVGIAGFGMGWDGGYFV